MRHRTLPLVLAASLALAGCASTPDAEGERPLVVASTSVYGDIVSRLAGDAVEVRSIIVNPAQDPHSYEVTARDRLALERADLVVANGGGYDGFVDVVLDAMDAAPPAVRAVDFAGLESREEHEHDEEHEHAHDEEHAHDHAVNEHVWYDFAVVDELAARIAAELTRISPDAAEAIDANAADLHADLHELAGRADAIATEVGHVHAIVTEAAPRYLLEAVGVHDVTPDGFAETIEEGGDIPPALLSDVLAALDDGDVALLAYNAQTAGVETERVREAAVSAGVPVVDVAETLPEGQDYIGWMAGNLDALEEALL